MSEVQSSLRSEMQPSVGTAEDPARSGELMSRARSCVLVIDMQERLLPVIRHAGDLIRSVRFLLDAAAALNIPAVLSEQYPRGLGSTVAELQPHRSIVARFEKMSFSAAEELRKLLPQRACLPSGVVADQDRGREPLAHRERLTEVEQVIICGIEAHVCVLQTALDLLAGGMQVFVVVDAIGGRRALDYDVALRRMRDAGCCLVTSESVVFEWCQRAGTDEFRAISRLVKERDAGEKPGTEP